MNKCLYECVCVCVLELLWNECNWIHSFYAEQVSHLFWVTPELDSPTWSFESFIPYLDHSHIGTHSFRICLLKCGRTERETSELCVYANCQLPMILKCIPILCVYSKNNVELLLLLVVPILLHNSHSSLSKSNANDERERQLSSSVSIFFFRLLQACKHLSSNLSKTLCRLNIFSIIIIIIIWEHLFIPLVLKMRANV